MLSHATRGRAAGDRAAAGLVAAVGRLRADAESTASAALRRSEQAEGARERAVRAEYETASASTLIDALEAVLVKHHPRYRGPDGAPPPPLQGEDSATRLAKPLSERLKGVSASVAHLIRHNATLEAEKARAKAGALESSFLARLQGAGLG